MQYCYGEVLISEDGSNDRTDDILESNTEEEFGQVITVQT